MLSGTTKPCRRPPRWLRRRTQGVGEGPKQWVGRCRHSQQGETPVTYASDGGSRCHNRDRDRTFVAKQHGHFCCLVGCDSAPNLTEPGLVLRYPAGNPEKCPHVERRQNYGATCPLFPIGANLVIQSRPRRTKRFGRCYRRFRGLLDPPCDTPRPYVVRRSQASRRSFV